MAGFNVVHEEIDAACEYFGMAEQSLWETVEKIRSEVIVAASEAWDDRYATKVLNQVDDASTALLDVMRDIQSDDVRIQAAANRRLDPDGKSKRWPEKPSFSADSN